MLSSGKLLKYLRIQIQPDLWANLLLSYYEYKIPLNPKKENLHRVCSFRNTFPLIDDMGTLNDNEKYLLNLLCI